MHGDLKGLAHLMLAESKYDLIILEGIRSRTRQAELVRTGSSQTMNSRHLTGHAIDIGVIVGGRITWKWNFYTYLGQLAKDCAYKLDCPILWGGDWQTLKDGPHIQLSARWYR